MTKQKNIQKNVWLCFSQSAENAMGVFHRSNNYRFVVRCRLGGDAATEGAIGFGGQKLECPKLVQWRQGRHSGACGKRTLMRVGGKKKKKKSTL